MNKKELRSIIREFINCLNENQINEKSLEEEYPSSFDMEHFKTLSSFASRIRYCEEHLKRLASGSSRIVYLIDDDKVLKLAKNKKGIAQNEVEIDMGQQGMLTDTVAKVFDYHPDNLWLEMEYAKKLTKPLFKEITGFNFDDYTALIHNYYATSVVPRKKIHKVTSPPDNVVEDMWEDEFTYNILQMIGNYEVPTGDLERKNSYGVVERNGKKDIVVVDYGLSGDVQATYYSH